MGISAKWKATRHKPTNSVEHANSHRVALLTILLIIFVVSTARAAGSDSAKAPTIVQANEVGSGTVDIGDGPCREGAPSCTEGHTCRCLAFDLRVDDARDVAHRKRRRGEGDLREQAAVDMNVQSDNGAGGFCNPWNGVGVLTIGDSSVTMPQHGTICDIGGSPNRRMGQGALAVANGVASFDQAQGQGTISFMISPPPASSASSESGSNARFRSTSGSEVITVEAGISMFCPDCGVLFRL